MTKNMAAIQSQEKRAKAAVLTEDEAKQRWCPFARTITQAELVPEQPWVSGNRVGGDGSSLYEPNPNPKGSRCIASECMAFRWYDPTCELDDEQLKITGGYCGLAGSPL